LLSGFAPPRLDGLEWAIFHSSGREALSAPATDAHSLAAGLQERTAVLPDYNFRPAADSSAAGEVAATGGETGKPWPDVSLATSFSGLLGATLSMLLAGLLGFILLRPRQRP